MEPQEIAAAARSFSVMARIVGPDPKAVKMRRHAFHLHQYRTRSPPPRGSAISSPNLSLIVTWFGSRSGSTTLSASAILLPPGALAEPPPLLSRVCASHGHSGGVALTAASLVEPFLVAEQRDSPNEELQPRLIPEARLDVLVEREEPWNTQPGDSGAPHWLSAQLLAMVDVPASADSVLSMLTYDGSLIGSSSWDVGWSLADVNQKQVENDVWSSLESNRKNVYAESVDPSILARSATRIAILGVSALTSNNARHINVSPMPQRGDSLMVVGSPFGILSPFHFFNSISVGTVANCLPPCAVRSSLLMADIHCLPGMEGAPVFDKHSCLVGMLMKPLRQRSSSIQVQLVITWDGICTAWNSKKLEQIEQASNELLDVNNADSTTIESCGMDNHRRLVSNSANGLNLCNIPSLRDALSSVVLVTVGDTSWASGILLNKNGLVLTNAHLLEPWRFGRTSPPGLQNKTTSLAGEHIPEEESKLLQSQQCTLSNEDAIKHEISLFSLGFKREKRISVRLDHGERQTWYSASVVFVSKGPLDVALLQMEKVATELCAIRPEFVCPTAGSSVYVIGHGLLGPRSGLCSSLSSGVVSKVVKIPLAQHSQLPSTSKTDNMDKPVMLQTTAAVHPGASGGVLVNSHGRMVGLITSNAKHGGGSTIPRLNFSIPCKSLDMVFKYSENGDSTILEQLDRPNELLSSVWALAQAPSSLPFLSSSTGKSKEGKVLEFSKFLADKQEGLRSRSDIEAFLRQKIPSRI